MIDWNIWHELYNRVLRRFDFDRAIDVDMAAGRQIKSGDELRVFAEQALTGAIAQLDGNAGESAWRSWYFRGVASFELGVARLELEYIALTACSAQKDEKDEGGAE